MPKEEDYIEIRVASSETRLISGLIACMPVSWQSSAHAPCVTISGSNQLAFTTESLSKHASFLETKFANIQIAESAMEVGDIGMFYFDGAAKSGQEGKLLFLIERKTKSDLHASFIDHRYQEQALRLRTHPELHSPRQVLYLLEVSAQEEESMKLSDKVEWFRTQTSLLSKPGHDFMILQTKSTMESALALLSFASKTLDTIRQAKKQQFTYPDQRMPYFMDSNHDLGYTPLTDALVHDKLMENTIVQMKKQGNLTPSMYFITILGCIPSVGSEMAKTIAAVFTGGMTELLKKANDDPQMFIEEIAKYKFGSTKRQSSIGKSRATNILKYLCPHLQLEEVSSSVQEEEEKDESAPPKKREREKEVKQELTRPPPSRRQSSSNSYYYRSANVDL